MRKYLFVFLFLAGLTATLAFSESGVIKYTEKMVGANHPTLSDTLNRALLVAHDNEGIHRTFTDLITRGPWVDVRAYAPVGTLTDGTVDWTTYIQAAINNVNTGGRVLFPFGKLIVSSTINLKNGTKLIGQGRNFPGPASPHKGTQLIFTGTGPCIKGGGAGTALYNVEIDGIEILASGAAVTDNTAVGIYLVAHDSFITRNAIWMFKAGSGIEFFADQTYPTATYSSNFTSGNNVSSNWIHTCNRGIYLHGTNGNTTSVFQYNFINGGTATGTRTCIDAQQGANYCYFLFNNLETADRGLIVDGAWNQIIGNTTEFLTVTTSIHITLGVNSLENKILSHNFISEVTTDISDLGTRNEYLGGRAAGGAGLYVGNKLLGGLKIDGALVSKRVIDTFPADNATPSIVANNCFLTNNASTDNLVITDFLGGEGSKVVTIVGYTSSYTTTVKDNHGTGGNLYLNGDWVVTDWATLTLLYVNTRWVELSRTLDIVPVNKGGTGATTAAAALTALGGDNASNLVSGVASTTVGGWGTDISGVTGVAVFDTAGVPTWYTLTTFLAKYGVTWNVADNTWTFLGAQTAPSFNSSAADGQHYIGAPNSNDNTIPVPEGYGYYNDNTNVKKWNIGGTLRNMALAGTLTNDKWCKSDGTTINCTDNTPAGSSGGYTLTPSVATASTLTDNAILYFGSEAGRAPTATADSTKMYIPVSGTITKAYIYGYATTTGTNEAWSMYIRLNNTTDTLIEALSSNAASRLWSNTALSIAVVAGDYVEIKTIYPEWATNPAGLSLGGVIYVAQ